MSKYKIDNIQQLTEIFKALSNPQRLTIFMRLINHAREEITACDDKQICQCVGMLGKDLGIAPSTVSHHIKELSRVNLITIKRRGQTHECSANTDTFNLLSDSFVICHDMIVLCKSMKSDRSS